MNIRDAMDRIVTLQGQLAITAPITKTLTKAYKYVPPQTFIFDTGGVVITNDWSLVSEDRNPGGLRVQRYSVHMQLFVDDADQDRAADIATGFMAQIVDKFDSDIGLNGEATLTTLRGGVPTLAWLERAGRGYVGLDLFLDVELKDAGTFG